MTDRHVVKSLRLAVGAALTILLAGCSEQSLEGVDLSPNPTSTSVADFATEDSTSTSALPTTTETAAPTTTEPTTTTENPADLGRTAEPGVLYVGPDGDDQNNGTLPSEAFRTLNHAVTVLAPGDQLLVLEGEYDEEWRSDTSVHISAKGTPDAWIRIQPFPGHDVTVLGSERNSFKLEGAEYLELSGFELAGTGTVRLGAGVHIEHPSHHIVVADNTVHGFPAGGVVATGGSHLTIRNNEVFGNARYNVDQHSGISLWRPRNVGFADDENGYSNYVIGNVVYDNRNLVPGDRGITDGNCVIVDQSNLTEYEGRTLIANNLCVNNGGRGVNVHKSAHVDVVNNTIYNNLQSPELADDNGEIMAYESSDARFVNNLVISSSSDAARSSRSDDIIFVDNLFVGPRAGVGGENTQLDVDPSTIVRSPTIDPLTFDFGLVQDSPALELGRSDFVGVLPIDLFGNPRQVGAAVDVGAIEG